MYIRTYLYSKYPIAELKIPASACQDVLDELEKILNESAYEWFRKEEPDSSTGNPRKRSPPPQSNSAPDVIHCDCHFGPCFLMHEERLNRVNTYISNASKFLNMKGGIVLVYNRLCSVQHLTATPRRFQFKSPGVDTGRETDKTIARTNLENCIFITGKR